MWGVGGIFLTQLPPIANVYERVFPSCLITFRFTNLKKAPRPKKATMLSTNPSKPVPKGTHDQVRALKDLDPDNTDDNAFKLVTHIIDFLPILLVVKISYKIMFSRALSHLSSFPTTPRYFPTRQNALLNWIKCFLSSSRRARKARCVLQE